MDDVSRYAHSPAHLAVARRDHAALRRLVAGLPRLPRAGEVATEQESIAGEAVADAVSAVIDRRDVPRRGPRSTSPCAPATPRRHRRALHRRRRRRIRLPRVRRPQASLGRALPVGGEDDGAARIRHRLAPPVFFLQNFFNNFFFNSF